MSVVDAASTGALVGWMLVLLAVAVAVPYLLSDRFDVARWVYVVVLAGLTAALWAGVTEQVGPGWAEAARWHWRSGLVMAPLAAVLPAVGITRMPVTRPRHGPRLAGALGWDAAVYGAAEGVLLSALPAFLVWQYTVALGSSRAAAATAALLSGAVVVVVHHLGYPEFRRPRALTAATVACGLLTAGYLVTGSVWTPVVGHVLMHAAAVVKGNALPPHSVAPGAATVASWGAAAARQ